MIILKWLITEGLDWAKVAQDTEKFVIHNSMNIQKFFLDNLLFILYPFTLPNKFFPTVHS
jgi:hypothetical protein